MTVYSAVEHQIDYPRGFDFGILPDLPDELLGRPVNRWRVRQIKLRPLHEMMYVPGANSRSGQVREIFASSAWGTLTIVIALALSSLPALGQSSGTAPEYCQQQPSGRLVCRQVKGSAGVAGSAPYERWQDGSPAQGSGAYNPYRYQRADPGELGRPNALYSFPR